MIVAKLEIVVDTILMGASVSDAEENTFVTFSADVAVSELFCDAIVKEMVEDVFSRNDFVEIDCKVLIEVTSFVSDVSKMLSFVTFSDGHVSVYISFSFNSIRSCVSYLIKMSITCSMNPKPSL